MLTFTAEVVFSHAPRGQAAHAAAGALGSPGAHKHQLKNSMEKVAEQGGIKPGQPIELDDGPFKGINAIFQAYDGEERAIVLITFMQKQQQVKVPVSVIRP